MADRTPRVLETRDESVRVQGWVNPRLLPDPEPEKGYRFRWVRTGSVNMSDTANVSMRLREGYEPVRISEHPGMKVLRDERSRFPDMVEVGGLMLCKIPEETARAREEVMARMAAAQVEAVDNHYMKESDPRMPLARPQRETRATFGQKPVVTGKDHRNVNK